MNLSFIYKFYTIYIIIMTIHHCALDIQFVIICNCKVYCCHSRKYGNKNDDTSFSCVFNCLSHCDIISCAIIDHICLVRTKGFNHCLAKVLLHSINAYINTTFFCFIQTKVADICDHYLCGTHSFCCLCNQVTDRSCTKNCNIQSLYISYLLHSMHCNCQRLDHGTFFIRHIFRNRCYFRGIYCKIF